MSNQVHFANDKTNLQTTLVPWIEDEGKDLLDVSDRGRIVELAQRIIKKNNTSKTRGKLNELLYTEQNSEKSTLYIMFKRFLNYCCCCGPSTEVTHTKLKELNVVLNGGFKLKKSTEATPLTTVKNWDTLVKRAKDLPDVVKHVTQLNKAMQKDVEASKKIVSYETPAQYDQASTIFNNRKTAVMKALEKAKEQRTKASQTKNASLYAKADASVQIYTEWNKKLDGWISQCIEAKHRK
jgi:hypothetical protein